MSESTKSGARRRPVRTGTSDAPKKPPVAVRLDRQKIVPVCLEAVDRFAKSGLASADRITTDSQVDRSLALWLDAPLFSEALVDVLERAVSHSDTRHRVSFYICSDWMNHCRIETSYTPQAGEATHESLSAAPYHCSGRTREIVSQHRAAIRLRNDNRRRVIDICFPR